MNFFKKQPYAKVTTAEDVFNDRAFMIADDDEEGEENLTLDEIEARHRALLQEASSTLQETETSVSWLKEERRTAAASVLKITEAPSLPGRDSSSRSRWWCLVAPLTACGRRLSACSESE